MTVGQASVSLDEINQLLTTFGSAGLGVQDVQAVFDAPDPATRLAEYLSGQAIFPRQWDKPKHYEFKQDHPDYAWIKRVRLPEDGLMCKVCDDCGSHVWVEVAGHELHLSMRITDFVQVTPDLQIKPVASGLLVRRPRQLKGMRHCKYACD